MNFGKLFGGIGKMISGVPDIVWWILLAIAAGEFIDLRARWDQRSKDKVKQDADTRKTIGKIEERSDARIEQADEIRAANPVVGDPDSVRERPNISDWNYRD